MRDVVILGVGMTKFGKFPELGLKDLGRAACWEAIKDAGVSPRDIQAGYVANAIGGMLTGQTMVCGQVILREVGIVGIPIVNCENACSSGSTAFREAWMAVQAGYCDIAIAVGVEKEYVSDSKKTVEAIAGAGDVELEMSVGVNFPAHWALRATKRMEDFGTKREHFAKVSVKNHKNGCFNPRSQYRKECTIEEVLHSRMIATPLTQLQCSPIGDGAAAVVLCSAEYAKQYTSKPILVAGVGMSTGTYTDTRPITFGDMEWRSAQEAYRVASIGPDEIDFAEVHDCFTIAEFMRVEGLGLCKLGEYDELLDKNETEIGGRLPINPSGGLLAKGHPIAATGIAQLCELYWQLNGMAGERQVLNAKTGLSHCSGGGIAGDGAVSVVTILKKGY